MLRTSNNSFYTKRGAMSVSSSISVLETKPFLSLAGTSLTTIYDESAIGGKLNKYFQMNNITEQQQSILLDLTAVLEKLKVQPPVDMHPGPEDQVTLSFKSTDGVHLIVITSEGDLMVSFSGFKFNKGWRRFHAYEEIDAETVTYEFLTS